MITAINQTSATGLTGGFSSIDFMTSIQMLLVQDFDEQMKGLGDQMKGLRAVKQAYRKDIGTINTILSRASSLKGPGAGEAAIGFNPKKPADKRLIDFLKADQYYALDPKKPTSVVSGKRPADIETADIDAMDKSQGEIKDTEGKTWFRKEVIENKLANLEGRLESTNSQSEVSSIVLQGLTNQRKVAFEALSNLISQQGSTLGAIVRNIRD